jgi:predicted ATPase with chaperone activity
LIFNRSAYISTNPEKSAVDFADVKSQANVKRALEIDAAGEL